jgi:4-hydroxy-tetrahydrodipicolinate synthase
MGKVIDRLVQSKVNGLLFLGSGGEFCHMSNQTRKEVAEFVIASTKGRLPVLVGIGAPGTAEVIDLGLHALANGADGVLVVNPYYARLTHDQLYGHYAKIAKSLSLPIFLYNFPALTGQDLNIPLVASLARDFQNIVGIKDTIDNISHTRQIITSVKAERPDFMVFSGFDEYLLDNLILGGNGAIPASSNIAPEICCGIYRAFEEKNFEEAFSLQRRLAQLMQIYTLEPAHFGVIKEAMRMTGLDISTATLAPITPLSEEKKTVLAEILTRSGLRLTAI